MDTLAKMGFIFIGQAICLSADGKTVLTKAIAEISKTYRLEISSQFPGAKLASKCKRNVDNCPCCTGKPYICMSTEHYMKPWKFQSRFHPE